MVKRMDETDESAVDALHKRISKDKKRLYERLKFLDAQGGTDGNLEQHRRRIYRVFQALED